MTTYTLTINTDELGLGVIDGGKVSVTRKRATAADQYPPVNALYEITTATNASGIATAAIKTDDASTYHVCRVWDEGGALVFTDQFFMPPENSSLHSLPEPPFGVVNLQFQHDGSNVGTPSTTARVNFTGDAASVSFGSGTVRVEIYKHAVDVRSHNGTADGSSAANAAALSSAVSEAVSGGLRRVYIPFDSWTVTTGTDAQGCIVCGNGKTALTGVMGAARYDGCIIDGSAQDYRTIHPHIPLDTAPKLVKVHDANTIRIVVEKPTLGYSYLTLKNNSTTAGTDSLATTTSDATMWRMTALQDAVECLVGVLTASSSNGTWAGVTLATDIPTYTSGTNYEYQRSTTIGAWYEWTVTVPLDGELIVGFLEASGASSDVTITVDGVAIDSNFTTASATTRRRLRKYSVAPGSHTVRVTNNAAGSTGLNLLGLYFARLKEARNDIAYDAYGIYRNSAYLDPVIQSSANDLVLKDYNSAVNGTPGIYGGSYHGGESSISSTLLIDGAAQAITSGNLYVGKSVELHQSCTITWSGAKSGCTYSGDSVDVRSRTIILRGGLANCPTVTGEFTARELYTTLVGVNEDFTALTSPVYKTLSSITDGATYALGQHNSVEYSYNNQRLRITHSSLEAPDSAKGGSYVWRVVGSYVKYYSPWVWRGKRDISSISSVTIIQAS